MLDVTIRVTLTPFHLEQIHHIAIHNKGPTTTGPFLYQVYLDGKPCGVAEHYRQDGALALLDLAMGAMRAHADDGPPAEAAEGKGNTD